MSLRRTKPASVRFSNLFWLAPFGFLGLAAASLARPLPIFPPLAENRIVTDATGHEVGVPYPVKTIGRSDYLQVTHAPETLFKMGGTRDRARFSSMLIGRFYPSVLKNDALWDTPDDVESLFVYSDKLTFFGGIPPLWQSLGFHVVSPWAQYTNPDDHLFSIVRVINAAIGHDAQGEAMIAEYRQIYADLEEELKPETLTDVPRVLGIGSSNKNWSNIWVSGAGDPIYDDKLIGIISANGEFKDIGRQQEAERILAINPDVIFCGSIIDFFQDPRWRGLKAVLNKRVYGGGSGFRPGLPTWLLDERPLNARFEAEIVHPDRVKPKIRDLTRAHFLKAYGYRLEDSEIDEMLGVKEQKDIPGFTRFSKNNEEKASLVEDSTGGKK